MTDHMPALPDFVLAGVARGGTTSLASWLAQHPELQLSPVKETNFFARPDLRTAGPGDHWLNTPPEFEGDGTMRSAHFARIETWEEYLRCFTPAKPGARWRGEASVSYSFYHAAPVRIAKANPQCKIVFVLRDPVTRTVSNYALFRKLGIETLSMDEALDAEDQRIAAGYQFCWAYTGLSRYRQTIERYLEHFSAAQIHLAKFEDLIEHGDPESWCALLQFLDVDPSFEPFRNQLNDTKEEQVARPLDEKARRRLREILAEETRFFESLFASEASKRNALNEPDPLSGQL